MKQNTLLIIMTGCLLFTITAVFYISIKTQKLRKELNELQTSIRSEQAQIHVIETDHAYLTRPSRIAKLLAAYNGDDTLSAPTPNQFIGVDDIPFNEDTGVHNASYKKD